MSVLDLVVLPHAIGLGRLESWNHAMQENVRADKLLGWDRARHKEINEIAVRYQTGSIPVRFLPVRRSPDLLIPQETPPVNNIKNREKRLWKEGG